jgi:hypothetical protein
MGFFNHLLEWHSFLDIVFHEEKYV